MLDGIFQHIFLFFVNPSISFFSFDVAPREKKNKAFARKPLMKDHNSVRVTPEIRKSSTSTENYFTSFNNRNNIVTESSAKTKNPEQGINEDEKGLTFYNLENNKSKSHAFFWIGSIEDSKITKPLHENDDVGVLKLKTDEVDQKTSTILETFENVASNYVKKAKYSCRKLLDLVL